LKTAQNIRPVHELHLNLVLCQLASTNIKHQQWRNIIFNVAFICWSGEFQHFGGCIFISPNRPSSWYVLSCLHKTSVFTKRIVAQERELAMVKWENTPETPFCQLNYHIFHSF
jgi:hypothetical protein